MKEIQRQMKHKQILEIAVCEKQNISGNYIEHDYVCIKLKKNGEPESSVRDTNTYDNFLSKAIKFKRVVYSGRRQARDGVGWEEALAFQCWRLSCMVISGGSFIMFYKHETLCFFCMCQLYNLNIYK